MSFVVNLACIGLMKKLFNYRHPDLQSVKFFADAFLTFLFNRFPNSGNQPMGKLVAIRSNNRNIEIPFSYYPKTKSLKMNRIKLLGIITVLVSLLVAFISEQNEYIFFSTIMAFFGTGWIVRGRLSELKAKKA